MKIDYKRLRQLNPEAARTAVLNYLSSNKGNIADCARVFGVQRLTVYDILKKDKEADLKDRSKKPKTVANKTSLQIENKVLQAKIETGVGVRKLVKYINKNYNLQIPLSTLRGIIKRNSDKLK